MFKKTMHISTIIYHHHEHLLYLDYDQGKILMPNQKIFNQLSQAPKGSALPSSIYIMHRLIGARA